MVSSPDRPPDDGLILVTGVPANGGSCVARHQGRVVFVRYVLPGERVRARISAERGAYWDAEAVEVLDASPDRIAPLCPIAGPDGSGCCDLAFADLSAARALKAQVVAEQLERLGSYSWQGVTEPVGSGSATGWRTRVRLAVGADGRAGFHRYHSAALVTDLRCGQLPDTMLDGLPTGRPGERVHVVVDDDGRRHVAFSAPWQGAARWRGGRAGPRWGVRVVEGDYLGVQRVGQRTWRVPVTAFWQAHREAAPMYSALVAELAQLDEGMTAWDLYGGAGVFAAVLADSVGETGRVLSVDTSRTATRAARATLADLPQVQVVTDSVRRAVAAQRVGADVAVLDPPRTGAGREVIDLLAVAGVSQIIHIGCEAASFARDVGLYQRCGYAVEQVRVFDSFPLTHHVECVAVLVR